MDPSGNIGNLNHKMEAVALNNGSSPDGAAIQRNTSAVDMLRFSMHIHFHIS